MNFLETSDEMGNILTVSMKRGRNHFASLCTTKKREECRAKLGMKTKKSQNTSMKTLAFVQEVPIDSGREPKLLHHLRRKVLPPKITGYTRT